MFVSVLRRSDVWAVGADSQHGVENQALIERSIASCLLAYGAQLDVASGFPETRAGGAV